MSSRVLVWFLLFLASLPLLFAVSFSCQFKTSCTGSEVGFLRVKNDTGGYENAHGQLMNYSGAPYPYTLCCLTDVNHTLDNNCSNENATVILKLFNVTNSHAQVPSINTYGYNACLALSPGNLTCEYVNTSCSADYAPLLSLASSEVNGGLYNQTNAHVANYSYYTLNVCCKGGNAPPTVPVLLSPTNGNDSVFERNVTFDWQDSTDPDGDAITYDFNLTQATCADDYQSGLASSTYTSGELCVDVVYWWKVRACDATSCSAWSSPWNFTIASVMGLSFDVNNTNFGALARNATENTTDNTPPPFVVSNTGNVPLNVTLKALDPLFSTSGLGNDSFQYKARVYEAGAFSSGQTSWANISATPTPLFTNLDYVDAHDAAYIDILVRLPYNEPAGVKSSTLMIGGSYNG